MASTSQDNSIRVWDLKTGTIISKMHGHSSYINHIQLIENNEMILSYSKDRTVRIWDTMSGELKVLYYTKFDICYIKWICEDNKKYLYIVGNKKGVENPILQKVRAIGF